MRTLRCGSCGGTLAAGARACEYCSAEVTLDELRLDALCPACSTRLPSDARWCTQCGLEIRPQAVRAVREGAACPRCSGRLQARSAGPAELVECASCAGLWLDPQVFERLCERAGEQDLSLGTRVREPGGRRNELPGGPVAATRARAYLACVTCGDFMVPRNFGGSSGVIVDVCRRHGIWLDHDELARALAFVRSGGLLQAREREIARLERRATRARDSAPAATSLPGYEGERPLLELDLERALRWLAARVVGWFGR